MISLFSFHHNHLIDRDNEVHTKGHIISKFIKVPNDIGTLTNIALEYDKTSSVLTGWAYPDDWQLMGVSIFSAEEQRMWVALNYNSYYSFLLVWLNPDVEQISLRLLFRLVFFIQGRGFSFIRCLYCFFIHKYLKIPFFRYTFCAYGKTLTSHKPIAMGLTGTC